MLVCFLLPVGGSATQGASSGGLPGFVGFRVAIVNLSSKLFGAHSTAKPK